MSAAIYKLVLAIAFLALCMSSVRADDPENDGQSQQQQILRDVNKSRYQIIADTNIPSTLTVEELSKGVQTSLDKIKSIDVKYRDSWLRLIESEEELVMKQQGRLGQANWSASFRYAMLGDKRLALRSDSLRPSFINPAKRPVTDQSILMLWNGQQMKRFDTIDDSGEIAEKKSVQIEKAKDSYFRFIGFGYQSNGEDQILKTLSRYRVLPKLQSVDGFPCYVISSGRDMIWIDDQHGFCVRRRVMFTGHDLSDAKLSQLRYCKDFSEAAPGIWWPKQCSAITYLAAFDWYAGDNDIHDIRQISVDKLQINDVPAATFEYKFPVGTFVADMSINTAYYMPDSTDLIQEAIKLGVPIKDGIISQKPGVVTPKP